MTDKETAHDDYLAAIRIVQDRFAAIRYDPVYSREYIRGWREAILALARALVQAQASRLEDEADPSDLRY